MIQKKKEKLRFIFREISKNETIYKKNKDTTITAERVIVISFLSLASHEVCVFFASFCAVLYAFRYNTKSLV